MQSLVGELRSHILDGRAKKKLLKGILSLNHGVNKKKENIWNLGNGSLINISEK